MSNGIRTTNLERQFSIDELIGNVTDEGVEKTARIPMASIGNVLAGTGAFVFGNMVYVATEAQLLAITPSTETAGGVVLNDTDPTKNGYYSRVAAAWVRQRGFPDTFAQVTLGGTANAQTGTVAAGVNPADVLIFFATVGTDNTGPMTLSHEGETARDVVNAAGNALSAGEWTGTVLYSLNGDGDYQLLFDAGAAAAAAQSATDAETAQAAAELARDQAQAAASSVSPTEFPNIATAEALTPVSASDFVRTAGYATAGDGGGALYKKVVSEPSHAGKFSITLDDGVTVVWYEIAEQVQVEVEAATVSDAQSRIYAGVSPTFIRTSGETSIGDGAGLIYEGVESEPADTSLSYFTHGINLRSVGSAIGNLTGGGGLAAAFDDNTAQNYTDSARNSASPARYIGRTLSGRRIWSAVCWPTTDQGFIQTADPSVTITLYGKTGAAPSSATDGTSLGSATFTDAAGGPPRLINVANSNMDTQWDHVWIAVVGDGINNVAICELQLFEATKTTETITPEKFSATLADGSTAWFVGRSPSTGHSISFARTGASAELVAELPISNPTPSTDTRRVVFSIPAYVTAGDLIEVTGEFEVNTNEGGGGANVGVWSQIILSIHSNGIAAASQSYEITEGNGRNCTPDMHHDTHVHAGALIAPATGLYYVNLIAWAANTSATGFVTVEPDYGHMSVKVTRGVTSSLLG